MATGRQYEELLEWLSARGYLDEMQMKSILGHYRKWGGFVPQMLAEMKMVDELFITQGWSEVIGIDRVALGRLTKDADVARRLDVAFCEKNHVVPVAIEDRALILAMVDPTNMNVVDEAQARSGLKVIPRLAGGNEINEAIQFRYRGKPMSQLTEDTLQKTGNHPQPNFVIMSQENEVSVAAGMRTSAPPRTVTEQVWTEIEQKQLSMLQENHRRIEKILRAVTHLLSEKKVL